MDAPQPKVVFGVEIDGKAVTKQIAQKPMENAGNLIPSRMSNNRAHVAKWKFFENLSYAEIEKIIRFSTLCER